MSTRVSIAERRARLVARHHLARTAEDVVDAVRGVVAMHSTDPITPYLGAWARVPGFTTEDLDLALLGDRSLHRLHAMRRTLFVVAADETSTFEGAASREVAKKERKRLEGWLAPVLGKRRSPARFLAELEARVLESLGGEERRTQEISAAVPELETRVILGSGKWSQESPISSRVLFLMAMDGAIVRTRAAGSWRSSQYRWARAEPWFGAPLSRRDPAVARAELTRCYLAAHGPATQIDLRWWSGWTAKQANAALAAIDAARVELEEGGEAFVLPDDLAPVGRVPPHVALLPPLDPTPMGWKERAFYLGAHAPRLFDTNGNVGPTVWLDGRVVGGWGQREDGTVAVTLLEALAKKDARRVEREAAALHAWLAGELVTPRFRTPIERELRG